MKPIIMKFGGTSVEGPTAFQTAARIVSERVAQRPVVVVSAMARFTDALLGSVKEAPKLGAADALANLDKHFDRHFRVIESLLNRQAPRMRDLVAQSRSDISELLEAVEVEGNLSHGRRKGIEDAVVSNGERLSAALLAAVLSDNNHSARDVDARRCLITDNNHGSAAPLMDQTVRNTCQQLQPLLDSATIPVLGGFIGSTIDGETTTLGRGGSDYSAAIFGAALGCDEIQIWTDVPGVLTADPRLVPEAHTVPQLSFAEAAELAYFGAKVLHPKTLQPAIERNIPVRICNSRNPIGGSTLVTATTEKSSAGVKAIAHKTGVTTVQITAARMLGAYGFLRKLFEVFDEHRTAVDVVTTSEVSVSLSLDDTTSLPAIVDDLKTLGSVSVEEGRAILCVVGEGLRSTPGIAARVFSTINDINVSLISQGASRINLTFAIEEARVREAVKRLHDEFFERELKVQSLGYALEREEQAEA
ncbi:MAG TPA: lysine-sensitive aspartokinase 3 [Pyrinomonadaceae bacterium]|nr:lysine-sensitive aspartokinase 3 [Pyrinomonadaceae bacterium]